MEKFELIQIELERIVFECEYELIIGDKTVGEFDYVELKDICHCGISFMQIFDERIEEIEEIILDKIN